MPFEPVRVHHGLGRQFEDTARAYGARAEDVTGAVVFLLGQGAGFVTGQLLPVNGGFVLN